MNSDTSGPGLPSALVAVAVIALIGAIACTAIIHYSKVDDALKIWSGLTGLVGVVTGALVSYFFTRATTQQATQTAAAATTTAQTATEAAKAAAQTAQLATSQAAAIGASGKQVVATALEQLPYDAREMFRSHPDVQRVMSFEN